MKVKSLLHFDTLLPTLFFSPYKKDIVQISEYGVDKNTLKPYKVRGLAFFLTTALLMICLISCKKDYNFKQYDKMEYNKDKNWIHTNGGIYKDEKLYLETEKSVSKIATLDWRKTKKFQLGNAEYTEIPFFFEGEGVQLNLNENGKKYSISFSLMIRVINNKTEAAIKLSQSNVELKNSRDAESGTLECFRSLSGIWINTWFRNSNTGNVVPLYLKITDGKIKLNAIKTLSTCYTSKVDTYEQRCWSTPGGGEYDNTCGYVHTGTTYYDNCGGGGDGSGSWPPSGGTGGSGNQIPGQTQTDTSKTPCPTSGEKLKAAFPNATENTRNKLAELLNKYSKEYGLNTAEKLRHFLSQTAAETGGFGTLAKVESTNYTTAARLLEIFPKYFSDPAAGTKRNPNDYLNKPKDIANYVYAMRFGNGDEASGDGYSFRGRGLIQLTFKENFMAFKDYYNNKYSDQIDPISDPSILTSNADLNMICALWFFETKVLNKITVDENTSVVKISKLVNGGEIGLAERKAYYSKAKENIDCL